MKKKRRHHANGILFAYDKIKTFDSALFFQPNELNHLNFNWFVLVING